MDALNGRSLLISSSEVQPVGSISTLQSSLQRIRHDVAQIRQIVSKDAHRRQERRATQRSVGKLPERGAIDPADVTKACTACRKAKSKCFNADGAPCARCTAAAQDCVYPATRPRGRKMDTTYVPLDTGELIRRVQDILDHIESEIACLSQTATLQEYGLSRPGSPRPPIQENTSVPHSALHNPLGVLASAAEGSADHQQSPTTVQNGVYWNNIYSVRPETDLEDDPVLQGIVTESVLDALIDLYFDRMRPLFMHLDRAVHTTNFLRSHSPFLTTSIAAVAAGFYAPLARSTVSRLEQHAQHLAARSFRDGSKSLEIIQAYLVLVHWAPCSSLDWTEDRAWAYQGQAMRLACEIRLDLPIDDTFRSTYRTVLSTDSTARLLACREKTFLLVSLSEIAMSTQSGRADTTSGHRLLRRPRLSSSASDDTTNQPFTASVELNHVFACALHSWHAIAKDDASSRVRDRFMTSWSTSLAAWNDDWSGKCESISRAKLTKDRTVDVNADNLHIMLLLLSLRIPGTSDSTRAILRQICELAVQLIAAVEKWAYGGHFWGSGGLAFAHNHLIIRIAYAAVLVLEVSSSFCRPVLGLSDAQLARELDKCRMAELSLRIEKVAIILDQIGSARPNADSPARYYAKQIRLLAAQQRNDQLDYQPLSTAFNNQTPVGFDAFDFSLPLLDNTYAPLDESITDPILSYLSQQDVLDEAALWP